MGKPNVPRKIIVHHTADSSSRHQFGKVEEYHRQKWNFKSSLGFFGGYHYFIERDGSVFKAREETEEGAHTLGENTSSISVALAGDFNVSRPSAAQILGMVKIIDRLVKVWQIPLEEIHPHRKFRPTSCYGLLLDDDWARLEYQSFLIADLQHIIKILIALIQKILDYVRK